jgi:hypothetical protein
MSSKRTKDYKAELLRTVNEVNQQKNTINNLEQYSRRVCLEIKGIPVHTEGTSRSDDLNDIVIKVANTMECRWM